MPTSSDLNVEGRMAVLRQAYGVTLRQKIEHLERIARDCHFDDEQGTRTSLEEARALSHKLAGSAATFGYAQAGQVARALEVHLRTILANNAPPDENDRQEIENLLRGIAREENQSQTTPARNAANDTSLPVPSAAATLSSAAACCHRLMIAQSRHFLGGEHVLAFESRGFEVHVNDEFGAALSQAEVFQPDVFIIAMDQEEIAGLELAKTLWSNVALQGAEIFFLVRSQEFCRRVLLNGISDEWLIYPPLDGQELASRVLRRVIDVKIGRDASNRSYMMQYLETFKRLAIASNEPRIYPPLVGRPAASTSRVERKKRKVLVIDDDRHLVDAISEALTDKGIEVLKAYSGFQGLQLARRDVPDLIITDFEMPNGTAEYLIAGLRRSDATQLAKVIVVTSPNVLEKYHWNNDTASQLNVLAYYAKPIDLARFGAEVQRHLDAPKNVRALRSAG